MAEKIDDIVLVVPEEFLLYANEKVVRPYAPKKLNKIVVGGETRQGSVARGLGSLPFSTEFVAIHDGARPAVFPEDIDRVIDAAHRERAAILARPASDTVKRIEGGFVISTLDRNKLYLAETPQVFQYDLIVSAHEKMTGDAAATDDAYLIESLGFKVRVVIPDRINIKVTTEEDLELVKVLLREMYGTSN
jgi:2-C-methyl-D-erythritol 4-phosphate cytidylyltransferase